MTTALLRTVAALGWRGQCVQKSCSNSDEIDHEYYVLKHRMAKGRSEPQRVAQATGSDSRGKNRAIPLRQDVERFILATVEALSITGDTGYMP